MKRVAHRDLPTAISKGASLDRVDITQVETALSFAGKTINLVYESLTDTSWSWDLVSPHDADELIYNLKMATIYKDLQKKRKNDILSAEEWLSSRIKDA
jgi:hypothetical protein